MTDETALVYVADDGRAMTDSRKVGDLFGKRHDDVLKTIRQLDCSEEFRLRNFAETPYVHPQNGQTYPMFSMTKDGFTFLVMGYTGAKAAAFKERYIAAFNALEAEAVGKTLNLNDPAVLRSLLMDQTDRVIGLEADLAEAAPKVAALERIALADKSLPITSAAKVLQLRPKDLFNWLSGNKWIYRRAGNGHWVA